MSLIEEMEAVSKEAGGILLEVAEKGMSVTRKSSHELVTTADLRSEEFLKGRLSELLPGAGFMGEETSGAEFPEPPFWVVDPLDGTNNYAHGFPMFCVSVALWDGSGVTFGCVYDPLRDECFRAEAGGGCLLNGEPVFCTERRELSECLVATGFPYHRRREDLGMDLGALKYFLQRVQGVRRGGSAALDLAYVACGRLDGFFEEHLKPWDMAAGCLLVTEAGGRVTAYEGGEWRLGSGGVVASGPHVHRHMRRGVDPNRNG